MEYELPFTATNRNGKTRIFSDYQSFGDFYRDNKNGRVGAYWIETRFNTFSYNQSRRLLRASEVNGILGGWACDWIVRDAMGRPVDPNLVPYERSQKTIYHRSIGNRLIGLFHQQEQARIAAHQHDLAIPGTGRQRRRRCRCDLCCDKNTTKGGKGSRLRDESKAKYDLLDI